jgi:hypothetical protein
MTNWRTEQRKCVRCGDDYRPQRQAQEYCTQSCRRDAAYGRERFASATKGRRRRRIEASDKRLATTLPGSFRNEAFSSTETVACKPTIGGFRGSTMVWPEESRNPLHGSNPDGSTPGALQGDDYPLTYDENGYPELPACLDRRKPKLERDAA